jgi:hypothetical protein
MDKKKLFSFRLNIDLIENCKKKARQQGITLTEFVAASLFNHLQNTGNDSNEKNFANLQIELKEMKYEFKEMKNDLKILKNNKD